MSVNSPEAEPRKAKQLRASIANRDKPLFTGRRPPPRLQQRSDFFTDSLNTSYVPSPSPPKKSTRPSPSAKAKQTNGSKLATSIRATPDLKDGNRLPSLPSSTSSRRRQQQQSRQAPTPQPSTRRSTSPAATSPTPSRSATRTPSPARGRQQEEPLSPTSESSPPRGLAEAYQRIEDEEYLAGREDDSVDDPGYLDGSASDNPDDMHQEYRQGRWSSGLSTSHKSSRRTSPGEPVGKIEGEEERRTSLGNHTRSSDEGSTLSSPVRPGEDTFDRVLTQYDKDERRVKGVLGSDTQPFKRSRTRDRAGLTMENLQRKDASSRSGSSTKGSPSVSSKGSDPSLNIPQAWGRKGRGSNTWLSRISGEGKYTGDKSNLRNLQPAMVLAQEGKVSSNPIVDWIAAAAEVPLPSIEQDSLQSESTPKRSTPASHLKRQTSSDRIRRWEFLDDDFTGRSLQVSDSPLIRTRNGALDSIREREIVNLEKSAVTTNRLGQLKEQKSLERVRRRSPGPASETIPEESVVDVVTESRRGASRGPSLYPHSETEECEMYRTEPLVEDQNGEPVLDGPLSVTKKPSPEASKPGRNGKSPADHSVSRPRIEKHDSRDLLRKLARATSASPGPSPTQPESEQNMRGGPDGLTDGETEINVNMPLKLQENRLPVRVASDSIKDRSVIDDSRRPEKDTKAHVQSTPQQTKPNAYLKTPLVMGAWIDTPLPTGGRGPPMPTPEAFEDEDEPSFTEEVIEHQPAVAEMGDLIRPVTKPVQPSRPSLAETAPLLPKSALAAIIEKAKSNTKRQTTGNTEHTDDTLLLDDSTIQSLEELLADNEKPAVLTPPVSSSPTSPPESDHKAPPPITTAEGSREQEAESYNHLTSRLSQVGLSIRDAKRGIASLERAVSIVPFKPSSALAASEDECVEAGEFHDFIWPCDRCGCLGRNDVMDWQSIRISLPRMWTWRKEDWRPRLTRLGLLTAFAWALVIAEWIAHDIFSPPFYASSMEGYGVDYEAPRPPLILAKLLWRSAMGVPLRSSWYAFGVLVRILSGVFGFDPGFFGWEYDEVYGYNGPWAFKEAGADTRSWGPDAAIGSDEIL